MPKRFCVVVLGDFGRSPRMQYHALSLSRHADVDVVAYPGAAALPSIQAASNIVIHHLPEPPSWLQRLPRKVALVAKALQQLLVLLWWMLFKIPRPDVVLMQNPPALPGMTACRLVCTLRGARFAIDWHNFSFSIMALTVPAQSLFVRLLRSYEKFWSRTADCHFCVTKAMQQELRDNWQVEATVLYDRPPSVFQPSSFAASARLFAQLADSLRAAGSTDFIAGSVGTPPVELFAWLRRQPTAIAISSTSWTPDEDFGILLEAALQYEAAASQAGTTLPQLLVLVTGKGPQRAHYEQLLAQQALQHVAFRLLWLEPADYPVLLGAADVGVCLHTSSSGLDLPMKVLDMYGSGLPVCAVAYSCIHELVEDGHTGLLFATPAELAQHLIGIFTGFGPGQSGLLAQLRANITQKQSLRWEANWEAVAWPTLGKL